MVAAHASATAQLIILKLLIALVFAVGFGMAGTSDGVESLLEGLLVLALAAFSWPVIARFFTFGSVQASSSGLATVLGFLAGQASQSGGRGPAGVSPDQWSMAAENRTMAGQATGGEAAAPSRRDARSRGWPGPGGGTQGQAAGVRGSGHGRNRLRAAESAPGRDRAVRADGADRRARRHAGRLPILNRLLASARTRGRRSSGAGGKSPAVETASQVPDTPPAWGGGVALPAEERPAGPQGGGPYAAA